MALYYHNIMKVKIVCVGKIKEPYFESAICEYKKRLSRFCKFEIVEVEEDSFEKNIEKKIETETDLLRQKCSKTIISLDRNGEQISSEQLAKIIHDYEVSGISEISFVIGGSNGIGKSLLEMSSKVVSLGKVTYPHQLFRVILTEQIYRAFTIINNLPYHK